jgi:hypothetical protein
MAGHTGELTMKMMKIFPALPLMRKVAYPAPPIGKGRGSPRKGSRGFPALFQPVRTRNPMRKGDQPQDCYKNDPRKNLLR